MRSRMSNGRSDATSRAVQSSPAVKQTIVPAKPLRTCRSQLLRSDLIIVHRHYAFSTCRIPLSAIVSPNTLKCAHKEHLTQA
jgi:hypothetical protein